VESEEDDMRTKFCPHCGSMDIHSMFTRVSHGYFCESYFECEHCNNTWEHHVKERPLDPPFEEEELDPERKKAQDDLREVLLDIADIENRLAWIERYGDGK
jgi:hypothetical protein